MRLMRGKLLVGVLFLLILDGCNRFHKTRLLESVSYYADECAKRDITHHAAYSSEGSNPGRGIIWAREFRCRIERVCVGKSEVENEACKQQARSYWGFDERNEKNWQFFKDFDDSWDAICTLNKNPYNPKFSGCSPKWKSQENYKTNPYWNGKTYDMPPPLNQTNSSITGQQSLKKRR